MRVQTRHTSSAEKIRRIQLQRHGTRRLQRDHERILFRLGLASDSFFRRRRRRRRRRVRRRRRRLFLPFSCRRKRLASPWLLPRAASADAALPPSPSPHHAQPRPAAATQAAPCLPPLPALRGQTWQSAWRRGSPLPRAHAHLRLLVGLVPPPRPPVEPPRGPSVPYGAKHHHPRGLRRASRAPAAAS